jgi:hypothetical protein
MPSKPWAADKLWVCRAGEVFAWRRDSPGLLFFLWSAVARHRFLLFLCFWFLHGDLLTFAAVSTAKKQKHKQCAAGLKTRRHPSRMAHASW